MVKTIELLVDRISTVEQENKEEKKTYSLRPKTKDEEYNKSVELRLSNTDELGLGELSLGDTFTITITSGTKQSKINKG